MADAKISELSEKTSPLVGDDLFAIVDTEVSPITTKKVKKSTIFVFGSQLNHATSLAEQSTTSTSYVTALTYTTPSLPSGDYFIQFVGSLSPKENDKSALARVRVGGTVVGEFLNKSKWAGSGEADSYHPIDRATKRTLSGAVTLDIQYRRGDAAVAYVRNLEIILWRVS